MTQAERWGITPGYHGIDGSWNPSGPEIQARLLEAMGAGPGTEPPPPSALVVRPDGRRRVAGPGEITTEHGDRLQVTSGRLPPGLPLGYHRLQTRHGERPLIVCPPRCHPPPRLREFGLAVQLYAARSERSWGIGDLADLAELGRWAGRRLGAKMLLLNPLHAPIPGLPQDPSPYYPSSRLFRNPLYLRVEEVPGADSVPLVQVLGARARRLNSERLIDHSEVYRLKLRALRAIFRAHDPGPRLDLYVARAGPRLGDYAAFCALSERYGRPWRRWPEEFRHPGSGAVARFQRSSRRAVRFHQWLQFLLDSQLAAAAAGTGLVNDLAIGVNPDGADAWLFQDTLARGISVGAPPDPFNAAGQDWGLPPFDPWKLRAAGYSSFIETLRSSFRHSRGLRIDHVMGLFRLYWIPTGLGPDAGGYVQYPASELLDILALESTRAGSYVVGEDLGTVQDSVRRELARRRVLSYRLLWFEDRAIEEYPELALAAVTTHDLPTVAGIWGGQDGDPEIRGRLQRATNLDAGAGLDEAVLAAHQALARAPSRILTATLEDMISVPERPNRPGTTERRNWSLALPQSLEEVIRDPRPLQIAAALRRR